MEEPRVTLRSSLSYMIRVFPKYDCLSLDGRIHLYASFTSIGILIAQEMAHHIEDAPPQPAKSTR